MNSTIRRCGLVLVATTVLVSSFALAAETHPFSVEDLVRLRRVSEPTVSPDERYLAFTVRETDMDANRGRTDLWLLDLKAANTKPRRLTSHPENDGSAQWNRNGDQVYFLSSRSGSQQVWRLAINGGEAEQVTSLPLDVTTFKLSPDNTMLALTLDIFANCKDLDCTVKRSKADQDNKARGKVYDRLFIRHWDTWVDGTQTHLFVVPVKNGIVTETPRDLTASLDADVPSKPFGDATEYSFAPDGHSIVFNARIKGKSESWSTNFDVYEVSINGGAPKNLTAANPAWDAQPIISGDGAWLAYRAMERPGFEADRFHIELINRKTGVQRALTKDWDRSVDYIEFSSDNKTLYAVTDHLGQHVLWSVDIQSGRQKQLTTSGHIEGMTAGTRNIYYAAAALNSPAELFSVSPRGGNSTALPAMNADALAATRMGTFEQFTFAGANNETVYAYLVRPADFDASKKYPVAFFVHGGPQTSYGNAWSYRWNPQTYAGAGYAFIAVDFHGSPGYGQKFTDAISGDWGGKPLVDLQKGLAAALAKYPWLDQNRMCALGASYGGYMINYMAGNWNAPFKCFVTHAGILDNRFMAYSTEELWFDEWENGGPQYLVPEHYEKFNPIKSVSNWRVPMLVITGEKDFRIPYTQGIAAFTAAQRRGIPSRLLVFPNENHWVLKPANSVQWHQTVQAWLDQWVNTK